ncbi:MAG: hypothetical protein P1V97_34240, partial [Planctomycetota bacterium]|nr:hypothetical protein [Planctomycetota bacterium]
ESMIEVLQDAAALLFWCHKMAPISTERKEKFEKKIVEEEKKVEKKAIQEGGSSSKAAKQKRREGRAKDAFKRAKDYESSLRESSKDDRRFEIMARYFQIADRFSDTQTAISANKASLRIQKEIFGGQSATLKKAAAKGDKRSLEKVARVVMAARKSMRCSQCEGKIVIPCKKCKGRAWKLRSYGSSTRRIDWAASKPCRSCNPGGKRPRGGTEPRNDAGAGTQVCKKSFCRFGLETRSFKRLFWTYKSAKYRKGIVARLKGINEDLFMEAIIVTLNPAAEDSKESVLAKLAKDMNLDQSLIEEAASSACKGRETWLDPFNSYKFKVHASGRVDATFLIYKPKRSINEELLFDFAEGKWVFKESK